MFRYCSRPCRLEEVILLLLVRNFMFLIKRRNILPLHIKGLGYLLSLLKDGFDRLKLNLSYVCNVMWNIPGSKICPEKRVRDARPDETCT